MTLKLLMIRNYFEFLEETVFRILESIYEKKKAYFLTSRN